MKSKKSKKYTSQNQRINLEFPATRLTYQTLAPTGKPVFLAYITKLSDTLGAGQRIKACFSLYELNSTG